MEKFEHLPGWSLRVDEVPAGAYKLRAQHSLGPSIALSGVDPSELIERAKKDVVEVGQNIRKVNR